jgi:hypothetical protein
LLLKLVVINGVLGHVLDRSMLCIDTLLVLYFLVEVGGNQKVLLAREAQFIHFVLLHVGLCLPCFLGNFDASRRLEELLEVSDLNRLIRLD